MLPSNPYPTLVADGIETSMPSLTYRFDRQQGRILGKTDGLDAMVQAVDKILRTERFAYVIYTANYGVELENLVGRSTDFVETVLFRRIEEALLADDRILSIQNFEVQVDENHPETMLASFNVMTNQGRVSYETEVTIL